MTEKHESIGTGVPCEVNPLTNTAKDEQRVGVCATSKINGSIYDTPQIKHISTRVPAETQCWPKLTVDSRQRASHTT